MLISSVNGPDLPGELHTWFTENEERLRSYGTTGDIERSPQDGRTKAGAWMTLENSHRAAVLIVWNSGEAELEYGEMSTGHVRSQHRELRSSAELLDTIETVLAWTRAATGPSPEA